MINKQLEEARKLINIIEIYNFSIISCLVLAFSFIFLNVNLSYIYAMVISIIVLYIIKFLHIERYLQE